MDPSEDPPGYRQHAGVELHGAGAAAQDEAAVGLPGVLGEERQEMAGVCASQRSNTNVSFIFA
jgi:hypothetical protein